MTAITRTFNKVKDLFPTAVPRGMTEFKNWSQSIIDTYNPPMTARDVRFTLAALLMRLDQAEARKPKRYFADALSRGAAAQVGAYVMEEIKEEQKREYAAHLAEIEKAKAAELSLDSGLTITDVAIQN